MSATAKSRDPVLLADYKPPTHRVRHVDMVVQLHSTATVVRTQLSVEVGSERVPLNLDGEDLVLNSVSINGRETDQYTYKDAKLIIEGISGRHCVVSIVQTCNPTANTALSGLYLSNNAFCTQMEAEGFRRFAFMQDRPDVMATYKVRLESSKSLPVLLSNGNPIERGDILGTDQHFSVWEDPHPKPTYLFALVAGDLASVHDTFKTSDDKHVALGIYVEKGKEDRCAWAMESLKASMRWDEQRFGRTYDLDVFNIVAVSDFNMGAMENKGLNIFNDKYILATPSTATDLDHVQIERIIAHEYFHNWTGNRITCRDWFQLCLKEGLTVFRDQEFTSDHRSRAVKRIEDVKTLRSRQFPEDQGPLSHAVRPSSYIEINNFYTPTVYEKGAEICRMLLTLLGEGTFRKAMDLFFERHDGDAATVEDFLRCMSDASGRDLKHFAKWYEQAGTPVVEVTSSYDKANQKLTVSIAQETPATPGQSEKQPLHLPLMIGLVDQDGRDVALQSEGNVQVKDGLLELTEPSATITFTGVQSKPVLSINRGFSAPIVLKTDASDSDLLRQMTLDADPFNRWEAAQTCARKMLVSAYKGETIDTAGFAEGLRQTLENTSLDQSFKALCLQLPGEAELAGTLARDVNAERLHTTRAKVLQSVSEVISETLLSWITKTKERGAYAPDPIGVAQRSLHLACLGLFAHANPNEALQLAEELFRTADNMTLEGGAIASVLFVPNKRVDDMLQTFQRRHSSDHLLMDKWFSMMAALPAPHAASRIEELTRHAAFSFKTPNKVYALIGGFTSGNLAGFHAEDGSGYRLLADCVIKLNAINPQAASRMATGFRSWRLYDVPRRQQAEQAMRHILSQKDLSNDVFEIISRTCA
jgi:aminopeptidase N